MDGANRIVAAMAALAATGPALGTVDGMESGNPLGFPSYIQEVTATFPTEEDARAAVASIAPLPHGARTAFTSRWDDSNGAHVRRAGMYAELGLAATFFINGDRGFLGDAVPKIKALGHRFGNHTVSHPVMMESGVNAMFREVMLNRIAIEAASDLPVTSFAIPYNWNSPIDPTRAAELGAILVETGHFVSSDDPRADVAQPPERWMPGYKFNANDTKPDAALFEKNFASSVAKAMADSMHPKATFGIHSWCDADGLEIQKSCLEAVKREKGLWFTDDSRYGAYRYEFFHSRIRKAEVSGKTARFTVERFDPAYLGAAEPLSLRFGPAMPVSAASGQGPLAKDQAGDWTLPHDSGHGLPDGIGVADGSGACAKFPGISLSVTVDEDAGTLSYAFTADGGAPVEMVNVVVNPAPMWTRRRINSSSPSASVPLGSRRAGEEYASGDRIYAVAVDFRRGGHRARLWATATVKGPTGAKAPVPRDTVLVLGPMDADDFDEGMWRARAVPGVTLPNVGERPSEYWRSMADPARTPNSAACFIPWEPREPQDFKDEVKRLCGAKRDVFLAAVDFICGEDGEKTLLLNREKWQETVFWINGEKTESKGGKFRIKARKGQNRLVVRWFWSMHRSPQTLLLAICEDGDLAKPVEFRACPVERRQGVFESDGFCAEFSASGALAKLSFKGETIVSGTPGRVDGGLPRDDGAKPKPVFRREGDALVCTVDAPSGTSGPYRWRRTSVVSRDAVTVEWIVKVDDGVPWKGYAASAEMFFPAELFAGKSVAYVDARGNRTEGVFASSYDRGNDRTNFTAMEIDGRWRFSVEGGSVVQLFDRRQWRQQTVNVKTVPSGGTNWGAPKADSREFIWRLRLDRM